MCSPVKANGKVNIVVACLLSAARDRRVRRVCFFTIPPWRALRGSKLLLGFHRHHSIENGSQFKIQSGVIVVV